MSTPSEAGSWPPVHKASSLTVEHGGCQHSQSARARSGHVREGPVEVLRTSRLNHLQPHTECPRRDVCCVESVLLGTVGHGIWLQKQGDATHLRNGLLEQFQRLADDLLLDEGQTCDIAAGPRKAGDEPFRHRIANGSEDDGEGRRRLLGGQSGEGASGGHDDIDLERNQLGRKSGEPLGLPCGIPVFDQEVTTLDVPEVTQSLKEGLSCTGIGDRQVRRQVAYSSDPPRLLPLGGERRGEKAASQATKECPPADHQELCARQREPEGRALSHLTLHPDPPPMELDELPGEG